MFFSLSLSLFFGGEGSGVLGCWVLAKPNFRTTCPESTRSCATQDTFKDGRWVKVSALRHGACSSCTPDGFLRHEAKREATGSVFCGELGLRGTGVGNPCLISREAKRQAFVVYVLFFVFWRGVADLFGW